jgi:hypothetical protein
MSPRSTQALHQSRDFQHFAAIVLIGFEGCDLVGQGLAPPHTRSAVEDRAADRLGPAKPSCFKLAQCPQRLIIKAHADGYRHTASVSQNVIRKSQSQEAGLWVRAMLNAPP